MATLVGQQLKDTYDSLLKTSDNDALGGTYKEITDGSGNGSNLYLGTGGNVGIGSTPSYNLQVYDASPIISAFDSGANGTRLLLSAENDAVYIGSTYSSNNIPTIFTQGGTSSATERMRIAPTGDISFRDGSANEAFYWDASAGSLQIGSTTSDESRLFVYKDDSTYSAITVRQDGSAPIQTWRGAGGAERMRIDSSGNVGLGVNPSASNASTSFEMANGSTLFARTALPQFGLMLNAVGNWYEATYKTSAAANMYLLAGGQHQWYNAPSGTAGNTISFTQAMTLDPSGNLLVGKTSSTGVGTGNIEVSNASSATVQIEGGTNEWSLLVSSSDDALRFYQDSTEHMRIDSSGNLLIGTSATPNGTSVYGSAFIDDTNDANILKMASSSSSPKTLIQFLNPNGTVGTIQTNASATAYNTSSDYRLKENVVPMEGALDKVAQLKPSTFNFISDADTNIDGFIAHEVAEIVPNAISGEKDAVDEEGNPIYQGIDHSKLVPILVGAIQELKAEIEQLKAQ